MERKPLKKKWILDYFYDVTHDTFRSPPFEMVSWSQLVELVKHIFQENDARNTKIPSSSSKPIIYIILNEREMIIAD